MSLEALLDKAAACARDLLHCLLQEREHLASRNLDDMQETTKTKMALFQQLESVEKQRHELLLASGYDAGNKAGMEGLLGMLGAKGAVLRTRWKEVLDTLATCRETNQINGGILELGKRQTEQALAVLRGQAGQSGLYDEGGTTESGLGQRDLGKA
jgi:flagella synthesis protein FlgN